MWKCYTAEEFKRRGFKYSILSLEVFNINQ